MVRVTPRILRSGRPWTRLGAWFKRSPLQQPQRLSVWHSGFLDAEAASQIGKEIRKVTLEHKLRELHPDLLLLSNATKEEENAEKLLQSLHDNYQSLTGEAFDIHDATEASLSDVEEIEVELRLLATQIMTLRQQSSLDEKTQQRISAMTATVAALEEEYETMKRGTHTRDLD